jgi:hypothetical protein
VQDFYPSLLGEAWICPVSVFVAVFLNYAILRQKLRADRGCCLIAGWNASHGSSESDKQRE